MFGSKLRHILTGKKGSSFIEVLATAAIIGILASVVMPELNMGLINDAQNNVNAVNAKTLTSIAYILYIENGEYPDWPVSFSELSPEDAGGMLHEPILFQGRGSFEYDNKTGSVTACFK